MNTSMEKASMTPDQKASLLKYLKYGLGAAVVSAGVGSAMSRAKANAKRKKALKVEDSRNAIVVDIRKDKFMEGLKTPEEVALERGEDANGEPIGGSDSPAVPQIAMSQEDIDAKKKEIKLRNGRMLSFFGDKVAESEDVGSNKPEETEKPEDGNGAPEPKGSEDRIVKNDAPKLPRDEAGRFVSPTSPIGVVQAEKDAGWKDYHWLESMVNGVVHPFKTVGSAVESGTTYPTYMALGGVGALYLSAMIVDKINEIRANAANKKTQSAQKEYATKLQEKDAQEAGYGPDENPLSAAGIVLGASFIIPATLSAMLANKVMERRKKEREDAKRKTDSYPDEPVILYKTSEDKEISIGPDTALFAILVKTAMFESMESDGCDLSKEAQDDAMDWVAQKINDAIDWGAQKARGVGMWAAGKVMPGMSVDEASNTILKMIENPDNNEHVLSFVKNPSGGISQEAMLQMAGRENPMDMLRLKKTMEDPRLKAQILNNIKTSKRTQDLIVSRATDDKYADSWGKFKTDKINDALARYGFQQGGILHSIFSWILNNTGLGNYFVKNNINYEFNKMREAANPQSTINPQMPRARAVAGRRAGVNGTNGATAGAAAGSTAGTTAGTNAGTNTGANVAPVGGSGAAAGAAVGAGAGARGAGRGLNFFVR